MRRNVLFVFLPMLVSVLGACGDDATGPDDRDTGDPVPTGTDLRAVTTGGGHACALLASGAAFCWGRNRDGQVGDGSRVNRHTPVPIAADTAFRAISAGWTHTCAVDMAGAAFCWGENSGGQLGDGTREPRPTPVPVTGEARFQSIHAGWFHTCGLTLDGEALCWGSIDSGALDLPPEPVPVAQGLRFRQLGTADSLVCGLTVDDEVYCWGKIFAAEWMSSPLRLADGLVGHRIATGAGFVCWLNPAGSSSCLLGIDAIPDLGFHGPYETPTGLPPFARLAAGVYPLCGLASDGRAFCWSMTDAWRWGQDEHPEEPPPFSEPTEMPSPPLASLHRSWGFSCGLGLVDMPATQVYCWGSNGDGQLGDGTAEVSDVAVRVLLP
ncbi:MAG: hypothetical protein RRA92_07825 [Gemmatimonadota bacterium]|nr:hypothetical protein [Gemmatimonadota bacterium]